MSEEDDNTPSIEERMISISIGKFVGILIAVGTLLISGAVFVVNWVNDLKQTNAEQIATLREGFSAQTSSLRVEMREGFAAQGKQIEKLSEQIQSMTKAYWPIQSQLSYMGEFRWLNRNNSILVPEPRDFLPR